MDCYIIALRNEKGSYNELIVVLQELQIIALRNEKGSYNPSLPYNPLITIIALRNEKGAIPSFGRIKSAVKNNIVFYRTFFISTKL